jgi:hypothetical protein
MYLLIAREREEISQNSNGFGFSRPTPFILCKKFLKHYDALLNTQKLSLLIFWFRVKILKNEKSGIPK